MNRAYWIEWESGTIEAAVVIAKDVGEALDKAITKFERCKLTNVIVVGIIDDIKKVK